MPRPVGTEAGPFKCSGATAKHRRVAADRGSMDTIAISFDLWDDPETVWALLGSVGASD